MSNNENNIITEIDKISENEISELTNNAVFKGGLSQIPRPPKQILTKKTKILQNLLKDNQSIQIPNSSIYSSGYLSFRNKKAKIRNPNESNNHELNEPSNPELITKSILQKLSVGKIEKRIGVYEDSSIVENNKSKNLEEIAMKNIVDKNGFRYNDSADLIDDSVSIEDDRNVFKKISINKKNNINTNGNNKYENDDEKYINSIFCTLSLFENGRAIFVSKDDDIFILPSLFVPKDLKTGNSYVFTVSEFENYSDKIQQIRQIQNKYQ